MNKENQKEVSKPFDISNFFLDGTQGKKLASKIYNAKTSLMSTKGSENFKTSAEEFTKLMVNSWVLNGTNNEMALTIATRIALDHLAELPDYYTRLKKMEEEGKNLN